LFNFVFSFVFFCFNSIGSSIFDTFQSRASKFEEELLMSYGISKKAISDKFTLYLACRNIVFSLKSLDYHIGQYINLFAFTRVKFSFFLSSSFAKLSELFLFEQKLILSFQEKISSLLLYPLVFQLSKNNISVLTNANIVVAERATKSTFLTLISR
jgi:hypothetical protein